MRAGALALLMSLGSVSSAQAHEATACTGFAWPVDTELHWMKAMVPPTPSGAVLSSVPNRAVDLTLGRAERVTLPTPPSGKSEVPNPQAGFFVIERIPNPGLYQVGLATQGWIDMIQDGKTLPTESESIGKNCSILQKSVRFRLAEGPATIELSSVPDSHIKLTIRAAE
jgi:hypothetical protein